MTSSPPRRVCIHGHFYQPPRENPWLDAVEVEDSAAPFHDWNERISAECYAANAAARLQTAEGRLTAIVRNYDRISFNFGPTLLAWMERADPATHGEIVAADRESAVRLGGHGNAIAQVYNHVILPLASARDRDTQVRWGIADFRRRFRRDPEGMWLAEAAVDTPSLESLAAHDIAFAVLSPRQAAAVAPLDRDDWTPVDEGTLDTTLPYRCELPSGRSIALFFYHGALAQEVAFGGLLRDGAAFADRLAAVVPAGDKADGPRLAHVATDGESYGHHHRFGDMALAYALRRLQEIGVEPTNYGRFLEVCPPARRVRIHERSSWSCAHGVERWRADCGCRTGGPPGWNQRWRGVLRTAFDELKERLDAIFDAHGRRVLGDPWAARDDYVALVLDRDEAATDRFLARHGRGTLEPAGQVAALRALEMQRAAMLMFTSCGWFFDDLAGLEAVQVMKYACRAARLAAVLSGEDLEAPLLRRLAEARSNVPAEGAGDAIYRRRVAPLAVDPRRVAAHHAIAGVLGEADDDSGDVYVYSVRRLEGSDAEQSGARLVTGRFAVRSRLTRGASEVTVALLHFGGHDFRCAVRDARSAAEYRHLRDDLFATFDRRPLPDVVLAFDRHFAEADGFGLRDAFLEERRRILDRVVGATLEKVRTTHLEFYREHGRLLTYLAEAGYPLPEPFRVAAAFALEQQVAARVEGLGEPVDDPSALEPLARDLRRLAAQAAEWSVRLPPDALRRTVAEAAIAQAARFGERPAAGTLAALHLLLDVTEDFGLEIDRWRVQNAVFRALTEPTWPTRIVAEGDVARRELLDGVLRLADRLQFVLDRVTRV